MSVTRRTNTLVELHPWDPETGAVVPLYFSSRGFITSPSDTPANQPYPDRLRSGLSISSAAFEPGKIGGGSVPDVGQLRLLNVDGWLDISDDGRLPLNRYTWDGRRCRVLELEHGQAYSQATVVYDGSIRELAPGSDEHVLQLRGDAYLFDRAAQSSLYTAHAVGLRFNAGGGSTDSVTLGSAANPLELEEWTVEFWALAPRGTAGGTTVFFRDLTAGFKIIRYAEPGSPAYGGIRVGSSGFTTKVLADGLWHHVAVISRSGTQTVIVDGEDWGSASAIPVAAGGDAGASRLGSEPSAQHWDGALNEVRIWGAALTIDQVRERMRVRLGGNEADLRTYYRLDEGVNLTLDGSVVASGGVDRTGTRSDVWVFDSAATPLGNGRAEINGSPTWAQTGQLLSGEAGKRQPLPMGRVLNWEPDSSDPRSNVFRVSSSPIKGITAVRTGGRDLGENAALEFDGTTGKIAVPDDAGLDWTTGEQRTFVFEGLDLEDNSGADQVLLHQTNGSAVWKVELLADSLGRLQASCTFTNGSGSSVQLDAYLYVLTSTTAAADVARRVRPSQIIVSAELGGPVALFVNGVLQGTKTMPAGPSNPNGFTLFNNVGSTSGVKGRARRFALYDGFVNPADASALAEAREDASALEKLGTPLVELNLNDGSGTTATDSGSLGLDGTITGGTWIVEDYAITNGPGGCLLQLSAAPSEPVRVDVEGWLPYGHCITGTADNPAHVGVVSDDASIRVVGSASWVVRWLHVVTGSSEVNLMIKGDTGADLGAWQISVDAAGQFYFILRTSAGTEFVTTTDLVAGKWYNIVVVYEEGESLTLYIDGEVVDTVSAGNLASNASTDDMGFLQRPQGAAMHHGAFLARALTAAEVLEIGADPFGQLVGDPDLYGYWPCDENSGATFYDLSPNSNHGTLYDLSWAPGEYPQTAGALAPHLANRAGLFTDRQDATSFAAFDAEHGSAPVGLVVRDQNLREALDAIVQPVGLWGINRRTRKLYLRQFRAPDVGPVAATDGSQYVSVADADAFDDVQTMEAWVRRRVYSLARQVVLEKVGQFGLEVDDKGNLQAWWVSTANVETRYTYNLPAAKLSGDDWVHVAAAKDGTMYVDGAAVSASSATASVTYSAANAITLCGNSSSEGTVGEVRSISLWRTRRTAAEVDEFKHLQPRADADNLIESWDLDEEVGAGTAAASVTGSNDGTWSAAPDRRLSWVPVYRRAAVELIRRERNWDQEDGQVITVTPSSTELPSALERVSYAPNQTPYQRSDLLGIVLESGALVDNLVAPYQIAAAETPGVETDHLLPSVHGVRPSALANRAGGQLAAELSALNHGRRRRSFAIDAWGVFAVEPGDEIRLQLDRTGATPRFDLPEKGRNFVVLQASRRGDGRTSLRIWG